MNSSLPLAVWTHGLSSVVCTAFALQHLWLVSQGRSAGPRLPALWAALVLSAAWSSLGVAYAASGNPAFRTAADWIDVLRFAAWYGFLLLLLRQPSDGGGAEVPSQASRLAPVALAMVAAGLLGQGLGTLGIGLPGQLSRFMLFPQLGMAVLALVLIEQLYRNVALDCLWNVKPLCLGLGGAFVFDLYLYSDALLFGRLDEEAAAIRGAVPGLVVPLLALSVSRSRQWLARIRLSQKAALHTATLLVAGLYLLFLSAVGYYVRYFGGEWGRALQMALVFVALLAFGALAFSRTMRARLRVLVGKHFFSYRYDYREEWLRFTRTLSVQSTPREMAQQVIRGLADMLESPAGGLWLRDAAQASLSQIATWNMGAVAAGEDGQSSLCRFLATSGWVVNLEEFRCFEKRYDGLELPGWLRQLPNAWLVVPLLVGTELIGFVVLASPRTRLEVNWEINDLLKTAGRQAASFLAQMQATEALLEARKFEAFNRMSAFVVHDLKNIVSQLSLLLRNAERHRDNPEFQKDMLMTVQHSVERMRELMLQLREGGAPAEAPCGVDLAKILGRIQLAKVRQERAVDVQVVERLVTRGHEQRIERVISHLVQNAIDATEHHGRVWVKLERQGANARIEVGDTGQGMSPDFLRERLFKPFQTTKGAGLGIGAYESFQYVQELGGKILVDSELNQGTRVTMLLPVLDLGEQPDYRQPAAA